MGLRAKWKQFRTDAKEACQAKNERDNSVNCPYCNKHYTSEDLRDSEAETDVNDIAAVKCCKCASIFGVRRKVYYEPYLTSWKESLKMWKNLSFDYDGVEE